MLIAIAIAEEIQGLQRIASKFCKFWASGCSLTLARSLSCTSLIWGESQWCSRSGLRISNWDLVILGMQDTRKPGENMVSYGALNAKEIHASSNSNFLPNSKKTQNLKTCRTSVQSFVIFGSLQNGDGNEQILRTLCVLVFFACRSDPEVLKHALLSP